MKLNHLFDMARTGRAALIAAFTLLSVAALPAADFFENTIAGINLGNASGSKSGTHKSWAIFALSGGVTITDTSVNGTTDVLGNVGVAGAGKLTMTNSKIKGDVLRGTGTQTLTSATITGTNTTGNTTYLNQAVTDATNASNTAKLLIATAGTPSVINTAYTYTAIANQVVVMNLTNLSLSGVNLTLNGPGGVNAANYVINISGVLSLNNAQVILSGGLTAQNVLFNVTSSAANAVTLKLGSTLNGIILAPKTKVSLTGASTVNGEVIGKSVSLSGFSKVNNPVVSP